MLNEQLFSQLIGIESVFPNERPVAEFLEAELLKRGFQVERQYLTPERFNLIAEIGAGERTVMYYAHMDTVPAYSGWQRPPFELTEDEDKYYGRGVADMKGGIAAFLSACDEVVSPNHKVILVLGVDEENISAGATLFAKETELAPDLVISLEGDALTETWAYPIILTWGRRGRAAYRVKVPGKSAHGATLSQGINAISEASMLVLELDKMGLPEHEYLPEASQYVRSINADAGSLSIPDVVELMIDRHLVPPETSAGVLAELRAFIEGLYLSGALNPSLINQFEIDLMPRETPYLDPFVTSLEEPLSQEILAIVQEMFGDIPAHYGTSVADENVLANRFPVPVLCVGPSGGQYHGADEWVDKGSIESLTQIYAEFLKRL